VMDCWTNFVKYGNPGWHPFTLANPYVMTFNIKSKTP